MRGKSGSGATEKVKSEEGLVYKELWQKSGSEYGKE